MQTSLPPANQFKYDELDPKSWSKSKVYSTERYFTWDRIAKDYEGQIIQINGDQSIKTQMSKCESDPNACRNLVECPDMGSGKDFNQCLGYRAYCTENLIQGGMSSEVTKWSKEAYLCSQTWYLNNEKNAAHCEHDAIKELEYLKAMASKINKANKSKSPHTQAFYNKALQDFSNIHGDLLKAREKIIKDREAKEKKQKDLAIQKQKLADNASACKKYLEDEHWNSKDRHLIDEIFPGNCGDMVIKPIESVPKEFLDNMARINKHIENETLNHLMNDVQKESLMNSFMSQMAMSENFHGVKQPRDLNLKKILCGKDLCLDPKFKAIADEAVSNYTKKVPANFKPFFDEAQLDKDSSEFNKVVDEINKFCADSRADHNSAFGSDLLQAATLPTHMMGSSSNIVEEQNSPRAQELLQKLGNSKFGNLMFSPSFSAHVGTFDMKECVKGGWGGITKMELKKIPNDRAERSKLLHAATNDLERAGQKFAKELHDDRSLIKTGSEKDKIEVLKKYMKGNPLAFKKLLENNPNCEDFLVSCKLISDILSDDGWHQAQDYVVGGVSAVAGVAGGLLLFTGVGTPLGAGLLAVSTYVGAIATTATIANSYKNYDIAKNEQQQQSTSGITGNRNKNLALGDYNKAKVQTSDAIIDGTTEAVLSLTPVALAKLKNVKNVTTATNNVSKESRIINESKDYFEGLSGPQKDAWMNFKQEANFEKLTPMKQQELLDKMYTIHKNNNGAYNQVLMGKKRDLVDLQNQLKDLGVSEKVAKDQVRNLASKENRILGEINPDDFKPKYTEADYKLKPGFKSNPESAAYLKDEYRELLLLRDQCKKNFDNPKFRALKKQVDGQLEIIELIYPKTIDLKEIKDNYANAGRIIENVSDAKPVINIEQDKKIINEIYTSSKFDVVEKQIKDVNSLPLKDRIDQFSKIEDELLRRQKEMQEIQKRSGQILDDSRANENIHLKNGLKNIDQELKVLADQKQDVQRIVAGYQKSVTEVVDGGGFSAREIERKIDYFKNNNPKAISSFKRELTDQIQTLENLQKKIKQGELEAKDFNVDLSKEIDRLKKSAEGL
jgi:hypothetical protein